MIYHNKIKLKCMKNGKFIKKMSKIVVKKRTKKCKKMKKKYKNAIKNAKKMT